MKKPIGFEKINGERFEIIVGLTDYSFRIEMGSKNKDRLWIFQVERPFCPKTKFENCIYIDFDWVNSMYNVYRVKIGHGTNGEFLYARSINRNQILSMNIFISRLIGMEIETLISHTKL